MLGHLGDETLTLRIQVCVYVLCEVQTEYGPGCLRTDRPCRKTRGESRLGCHPAPERQRKPAVKRDVLSTPGSGTDFTWGTKTATSARRVRPAHKADWAGRGLWSPRSGRSRRTSAWAEGSRFRPPPALWTSCCGPASSLTTQSTVTGVGSWKRRCCKYEHKVFCFFSFYSTKTCTAKEKAANLQAVNDKLSCGLRRN